jgi:GNAT superfamily N-acetyltransferase
MVSIFTFISSRLHKRIADVRKVLSLLSTDPDYQKKGLATILLNHVFDLADAEGRKVYVESTMAGHPVYERFGFRDIDLLRVDLSKWGGEKPGLNTIMLRDPQPIGK